MTLYAGFTGVFVDRAALESPLFETFLEAGIYCYIQGFSGADTPEQAYYGTLDNVAETFKISRHTAMRTLDALEKKGLLKKKTRKGKASVYRTVPLKALSSDPCQNGTGVSQNGTGTCAKLEPPYNNIKYNNKYIINARNTRACACAREDAKPLERTDFDAALRRKYQREAWKKK